MKAEIIVASDTHGKTEYLQELQKAYPKADVFLHCGDLEDDFSRCPGWIFVRGNNDWAPEIPEERIVRIGDHQIYMTHSHRFGYGTKRNEKIAARAKSLGCDIAVYGHTHVGRIDYVHGVWLINPGSMRLPRDGKLPSYARIVIEDDHSIQANLIYEDHWPFEARPFSMDWRW